MRNIKSVLLTAVALAATLAISGCGGGAEVGVVVAPNAPSPDFDLIALIDGHRLSGVDVFPGDQQTISVISGDSFELDADGPVYWDLLAGGSAGVEASAGSTFLYQGASLNETSVGDDHLVLAVSSTAPAGSSIPVTINVTSMSDSSQIATINLLITN